MISCSSPNFREGFKTKYNFLSGQALRPIFFSHPLHLVRMFLVSNYHVLRWLHIFEFSLIFYCFGFHFVRDGNLFHCLTRAGVSTCPCALPYFLYANYREYQTALTPLSFHLRSRCSNAPFPPISHTHLRSLATYWATLRALLQPLSFLLLAVASESLRWHVTPPDSGE